MRDQALLEVNKNNVAVLRKQLEATQDRFRVGEVTRTDVAQAESSLAQALGQLVTAQGNLENSRAEYVRAVGRRPGTLMLPRERPALPATLEEAVSLAGNNNFNVVSANFTELAARNNIEKLGPDLAALVLTSRDADIREVASRALASLRDVKLLTALLTGQPIPEGIDYRRAIHL